MGVLALDIGGANIKAANGLGFALSEPLELWKHLGSLPFALASILQRSPPAERIVVTMTGELADCFSTKAEGVAHIVAAVMTAAGHREVWVYQTDGSFVPPDYARTHPVLTAASNWHALARFAGKLVPDEFSFLFDIGSTTTDIIPICDGIPVARGRTDPDRLLHGELVYSGVVRSPVAALCQALPWHGRPCPVAQEVFATTLDAYILLGDLPEDPNSNRTADGRPATKDHAWDRLARSICADRSMFSQVDALNAARTVAQCQFSLLMNALKQTVVRYKQPLAPVVVCGQGEFLARGVVAKVLPKTPILSITSQLGPEISQCATAHALAVLALEPTPQDAMPTEIAGARGGDNW